jgi:DNA polymerase-3 subunit epsilon
MKENTVRHSEHVPEGRAGATFVAIDFETADYGADSACALGLVRVENDAIVDRAHFLIRPPRRRFVFTYLHGIAWSDVAGAPTFGELWPEIVTRVHGASFLAAHNASFDRGVLSACCRVYGLRPPALPYCCTVRLARRTWNLYPTKLPNVCAFLDVPLKHHDAASDAEACARIVIAARAGGRGSGAGRMRAGR